MSDLLPDPPRWKERQGQSNLAEREAGRAIRFMRTPEPLPAVQLTRIAAHIRATRPRRRAFWLTATAVLLFGSATVASAAHLNVLPGWLTRIVKPRPAETAPRKRAALGPSRKIPASATERAPTRPEMTSQPVPPPPAHGQPAHEAPPAHPSSASTIGVGSATGSASTPSATPKPVRKPIETVALERSAKSPSQTSGPLRPGTPGIEPAPMVADPTVSTRSPVTQVALLEEPTPPAKAAPEAGGTQGVARFLSEAIHALRVEHSPGRALFLLDRHATQLGKSAFAHEALLLRVEAMLALHRGDEVLQLLDGAALTDVAASRSLLVTRGELRAKANRCADGLGDFDLVLAKSKQADRQALFGRALCRKKLGDRMGAQADVERYRREFPTDPRLRDLEQQVGVVR